MKNESMASNFYTAFFLVTFLSLISCSGGESKETRTDHGTGSILLTSSPNALTSLELAAALGGTVYQDTTEIIHIAATIINPSDDTIKFISMSCSYEDLFTTNSNDFKIQSRYDCYSNAPSAVWLPPKAKTNRYIMIRPVRKGIKLWERKIKIGMYFLRDRGDFSERIKQYPNRQSAEVLWSNELDLKRLFKDIYY